MKNRKLAISILLILTIAIKPILASDTSQAQGKDTTSVKRHGVQPVNDGYTPKEGVDLDVQYENGKLLVFARSKTVKEVFAEIAKLAKIEIIVDEETGKEKTSLMVKDKSLKEGIEAVLNTIGQRNLAITWKESQKSEVKSQKPEEKKYEIEKVEIRKRSKAEMEKIAVDEEKSRQERYQEKEKWYKNLFKDMGKKGKLEGMLKDYAEGKEVDGINTYLRQATIKPEEKPLLREAFLDSKFKELMPAIEMGLIHAIGDNPEENDKEFILKVLNGGSGFFVMATKFIWDDRFILPLTNLVKNGKGSGRNDAAQVLGNRKVKEAVPALEEAFSEMSMKKENITYIHGALTDITGMTYKIVDGKAKAFPYETPKADPEMLKERERWKKMIQDRKDGVGK